MRTRTQGPSTDRRAGFTLIELILTSVLLSIVMGAVVLVGLTSQGVYDRSSLSDRVESRAVRALDRIVREMDMLGGDGMLPDPTGAFGSEVLNYRTPVGVVGSVPQWSVPMRIGLEHEAGDPNDGVDNDGDGLVDEGRVVLVRDFGATLAHRTVLASGVSELLEGEQLNGADDNGNGVVDERGFNIHRVGDLVHVRLSLEGADDAGNVMVRTVETSFKVRN